MTELLSYSRLEQAQLQREPFELEDLLRQCLGQQEVESEARELQVQIAPDIGRMQGDAHLVARVVGNLLGNALKYARHQVRFSARALPAAQWELRVEDDGPGIPEGERQRVFEPFVRLPQTGNLPGHGLGLAIAARGVALHGGAIQIEKAPSGALAWWCAGRAAARPEQVHRGGRGPAPPARGLLLLRDLFHHQGQFTLGTTSSHTGFHT
ncbi:MAG: ATP-binding protein [Inhella sp.]